MAQSLQFYDTAAYISLDGSQDDHMKPARRNAPVSKLGAELGNIVPELDPGVEHCNNRVVETIAWKANPFSRIRKMI
jgi:hypothetical protein